MGDALTPIVCGSEGGNSPEDFLDRELKPYRLPR
jgi:hypothetical protein